MEAKSLGKTNHSNTLLYLRVTIDQSQNDNRYPLSNV